MLELAEGTSPGELIQYPLTSPFRLDSSSSSISSLTVSGSVERALSIESNEATTLAKSKDSATVNKQM